MIEIMYQINEIVNMPAIKTIIYLVMIMVVIVSIFSVVFIDKRK